MKGSTQNTCESPFDRISAKGAPRTKQVWAIGGGKGGVGKSLVSSSLALSLANAGDQVVAVDMDLGGANLHTALGIDLPKQTLSDFFSKRVEILKDCLVPSGLPNLDIISGAQDSVQVPQIGSEDKIRLLEGVSELGGDYAVLDLGAGSSENTVDFFLYADVGIIVILPEPTSIENAYRFIKSAYYRRLFHAPSLKEFRPLIQTAMDSNNAQSIKSPADLLKRIHQADPQAGIKLKQEIGKFQPKLILNQARTQTDIDIGYSVKAVCKKYFGIDLDYVGHLDYDSAVWQAVRRKRPLMLEFPNSKLVISMDRIAQYLKKRCSQQRCDLY